MRVESRDVGSYIEESLPFPYGFKPIDVIAPPNVENLNQEEIDQPQQRGIEQIMRTKPTCDGERESDFNKE